MRRKTGEISGGLTGYLFPGTPARDIVAEFLTSVSPHIRRELNGAPTSIDTLLPSGS